MVQPGALVQRQREIVAGTFNVTATRTRRPDRSSRENLVTLGSRRDAARAVETLVPRMGARGVIGIGQLAPAIAKRCRRPPRR